MVIEIAEIGQISELVTSGSRGWAAYYADSGALFLRMTNLPKDGIKLLLDDKKYVQLPEGSNEGKRTAVRDGDILISITAELGKIGFVEGFANKEAYVNQHICLIRPIPSEVNPKFLAYYLSSPSQRYLLNSLNDSGAKSGLNLSTIAKFRINLPDINLQEHAVYFLEHWEAAIEKTEALIDAKERQFRWLVAKLIGENASCLSRLGDHFGKDITIGKGKPLIKANIAQDGGIPVIAAGKTSPYNHDQSTHSTPCITISASGAHAGYVWFHDYPIWASDCNVIHTAKHSIEYLYFALKLKQPRIYAFQSGGGQPHVYARDLKNIIIPLPKLEVQKHIPKSARIF